MTPAPIRSLLESRALLLLGRIALTFMFWLSGLTKLINFQDGVAEMSHFGLEPAWLFNALTIIVQLGGSLLIIFNRAAWLGAGALAVFTVMTIPIAHAFWNMEGEQAFLEMMFVFEHITVIGALILASILGHRTASR
ncbi:DoxX family protein [Pigmentiphaga sp.]|jgi:Predicted membrane protein|uniref:DoxX family protein n=1 Tax=Pigmentiphaga sp. TaxID=1977564 RepID=UPI0025E06DE3|nr:DoxX family protein [Pigmentiphaga sp.]MBX6320050.1 DoxX family protein [Pigmentiphaga sp.]